MTASGEPAPPPAEAMQIARDKRRES